MMTNLPSCAENWLTITAESGVSADLDLDSVKMSVYSVEYNIRIKKEDITYINRFSTQLHKYGTPTAVISSAVYADGEKIDERFFENYDYKNLEDGSFQAEIFDVLSKTISVKNFSRGQTKWINYLNRQQKIIQENWEPDDFKNMDKDFITTDEYNPVYVRDTVILTDKNGKVISKYSSGTDDLKIKTIEPLPEGYNQETFTLTVNKNYYKYKGASKTKKPLVIETSPNSATVKISKNSRPFIFGHIQYALLWSIKKLDYLFKGEYYPDCPWYLGLFLFPVGVVTTVGGGVAYVSVILLFGLIGGDIDDID